MKKNYIESFVTMLMGVFFIILWLLGRNSDASSSNKQGVITIGGLLLVIGIVGLFIEKFMTKKLNKKIGYVNENDELNIQIRCKAGNTTFKIMFLVTWIVYGLIFSGVMPITSISINWIFYLMIALPLVNLVFTWYYSTKLH